MSIPVEFKDWAIKYLNEVHDKEQDDQKNISQSLEDSYQDCLKKINNLVKLKISPLNTDGSLLSDDEFQRQMIPLQQEKKTLDEKRNNLSDRVDKWVELSQKTFDFACHAKYWYEKSSLKDKRIILQTIGSNFLLKDKTLYVDVLKPYQAMETLKPVAEDIIERLEPVEGVAREAQLATLFASNPIVSTRWDDFRTLDWDDMVEFPQIYYQQSLQFLHQRQ